AGRRARPSGPRRAVVASALDGGAFVEGPARDADTVRTGRERAGGDGEGRGVRRTRLRDAARVDPRGLPARARDSAAEGVVGADGEAVLCGVGRADLHGGRVRRREGAQLVRPADLGMAGDDGHAGRRRARIADRRRDFLRHLERHRRQSVLPGSVETVRADIEQQQLVTLVVVLVERALLRGVGLLARLLVEVLAAEEAAGQLGVALDRSRDQLADVLPDRVRALEVLLAG